MTMCKALYLRDDIYRLYQEKEYEAYKILWDLAIKADYLITTRRPYQVIIYKKKEEKEKKREPAE